MFVEKAFDLLADAVHALIGYNHLVDLRQELRGVFRSPFRYREGAILLSFVEFDVCTRISLGELKEYPALGKLCRRNIGKLFDNFVLGAVEAVSLRIPTGIVARIRCGLGCG